MISLPALSTLRSTAVVATLLLLTACSEQRAPDGRLTHNGSDWTFVNYWAEWCKPCIKEIPELNALDEQQGFRVLGVNFDGVSGADLEGQIAALGVAFPTLDKDPGENYELQRPQVLPTTLVLTPQGELHRVLIGPQTAESLIEATGAGAANAGEESSGN
ncbi:MAG: TlpA disulfide reductase family protein [Pseudomonadota bacterium]